MCVRATLAPKCSRFTISQIGEMSRLRSEDRSPGARSRQRRAKYSLPPFEEKQSGESEKEETNTQAVHCCGHQVAEAAFESQNAGIEDRESL
jgi:hypothetical protein